MTQRAPPQKAIEHPSSEKVRRVYAERVPDGPDALRAL